MNQKHIIITTILVLLMCGTASAWLSGYDHRMAITVNNGGASTLTNYQFNFTNDTNVLVAAGNMQASGADCRVTDASDNLIPFWNETSFNAAGTKIWANATLEVGSNMFYMYYGNAAASSVANGTNAFEFFDGFEDSSTIAATYLTDWTESLNNPLVSLSSQNWFFAVYSNYNSEDKIYLFEQRVGNGDHNIYARSFTRANADTPANWVDHGIVFTDTEAWCAMITEPMGIIWETQSMADAREGVGAGLGTRKWRMYYDGESSAGSPYYGMGFATASESDLLTWTAYSGNPVYPYNKHGDGHGFPDGRPILYNNEVWILMGDYTAAGCQDAFFTHSANGIDNWVDLNGIGCEYLLGSLVNLGDGILITGRNPASTDESTAHFTTDGVTLADYSGNPLLSAGTGNLWGWASIVINKTGSPDIASAGTYYMYYIPRISDNWKLELATSTTVTQEGTQSIDLDKWTQIAAVDTETLSGGTLTLIQTGTDFYGYKSKTNVSKPMITESRFRYLTANNWAAWSSAFWVDSDNYAGELTNDIDGNIAASKEAGAITTGSTQITFTDNTWTKMRTNWKAGEVTCYKDDVLQDTITTNVLADSEAAVGLILRSNAATGSIMGEWDFVFARKYADTEPTASLGAEEDAPSGNNDITLAANKYGMLRKDVTAAQTFSTIASGFVHDICFTWWDDVTDTWKSYWVGDSYGATTSVPEHESYFVLMDGTGETVSCGVAPAETVVIPTGWSSIYLRESTNHTLTEIKTGMQVDGTVTNLYAWNHGASGTGAWVSVDVTPAFVVEPNEGLLINNGGAQYSWDGSI